jgi:hypothetical protein
VQASHGGIERREQLVGRISVGTRQPIEERGLAGVGVAHQRDGRHFLPLAFLPRRLALLQHFLDAVVQRLDALADQATVGLELRFARAAQADAAAALAVEVGPAAHQARGHVLELRQLDLQLALEGARALGENREDESAAIEHAALQLFLQVAFLAGTEWRVDHHEVGGEFRDPGAQLLHLAGADEEARVGRLAGGRKHFEHLRAGRTRQRAELLDAIGFRSPAESHADQDRTFAAGGPFKQ